MMNTRKPLSPDEQMALQEEPFEPKKFQTTMSGMMEIFKASLEEKEQPVPVAHKFQTTRSGMNEAFRKQHEEKEAHTRE